MKAYHITDGRNLNSIKKHGLTKGTGGNDPTHSGDGIYFFADFFDANSIWGKMCETTYEWRGVLLVEAEVSTNSMLMDEDALFIGGFGPFESVEQLHEIMPEEAVAEYKQWLSIDRAPYYKIGEDMEAQDTPEAAAFKVGLIDKWHIKPDKRFLTPCGDDYRSLALTFRVPKSRIPVTRMMVLYDGYTEYLDKPNWKDVTEDDLWDPRGDEYWGERGQDEVTEDDLPPHKDKL